MDTSITFLQQVFNKMTNKSFLVTMTAQGIFFLLKVIACVILYYVSIRVIRKILPYLSKSKNQGKSNSSLSSFLRSVINFGLHAALITICLLILGVKETSLFAFFGTLGIGVGFALKDTLTNFAGGIIILVFKTYSVGDEVLIAGELGKIYEIDIFFTSIKTYNEDIVMIPNSMIISNKVINYNSTSTRRLKFIIGVDYDCDLNVARETLENILLRNPLVLKEPRLPYTHVNEYSDSSINIALKGWVRNKDYWTVYKQTLNEIRDELYAKGIGIPFPQMDIHFDKEAKIRIDKN